MMAAATAASTGFYGRTGDLRNRSSASLRTGCPQWNPCLHQCHSFQMCSSSFTQLSFQSAERDRLSVDRDLQMHAFNTVDDFAEDDGNIATSQFEVPNHLLPKVAIVGRPNVGKSALFNKLAGGDIAIVNDEPGVTRDRLYARGFWGLQEFMVVDTGGLLSVPKSESVGMDGIAVTSSGGQNALTLAVKEACMAGLPGMIEWQAAAAIEDAKVILFVVDGQAGVTSVDKDIANWLRKKHSHKKIVHAVNKCEPPTKGFQQAIDCWSLGHRRSS